MRKVNKITWDLLNGQWFLQNVKPENKGEVLNILTTNDTPIQHGVFTDKGEAIYKRIKIR